MSEVPGLIKLAVKTATIRAPWNGNILSMPIMAALVVNISPINLSALVYTKNIITKAMLSIIGTALMKGSESSAYPVTAKVTKESVPVVI